VDVYLDIDVDVDLDLVSDVVVVARVFVDRSRIGVRRRTRKRP
jgi:hypothetical protein